MATMEVELTDVEKRWLQDHYPIIIMLLIFTLGILAYVIPPDELIINPVFKTRTELFLTITIGMFALLEGYSTFLQLRDNRKRARVTRSVPSLLK